MLTKILLTTIMNDADEEDFGLVALVTCFSIILDILLFFLQPLFFISYKLVYKMMHKEEEENE